MQTATTKTLLRIITPVAIFVLSLFCAHTSNAQAIPSGITDAVLTPRTEYPEPNTAVPIRLDAYTTDTVGAKIRWFIDGKEHPEFNDLRNITVMSGAIGTTQTITAQIIKPNKSVVRAQTTLTAVNIDIIIEAYTYVPPFYAGRPLPSKGSPIRATAIVNTGTTDAARDFSYTWKLNDALVSGGATLGQQSVFMFMPRFPGEIISVTVFNANGDLIGEESAVLTAIEPELHFYEANPLRGIGRKALSSQHVLVGDEMTVRAAPYFIDTTNATEEGSYTWTINGAPIENTDPNPLNITLRRTEKTGVVSVGLEIITGRAIPQMVEGVFSLFTE